MAGDRTRLSDSGERGVGEDHDAGREQVALAQLVEWAGRYRAIGESVPYGVWLSGPDGGAVYLSDSFLDLLGMTMTEAAGFGWTQALHPDDRHRVLTEWKRCVQNGHTWDYEFRVRSTAGDYCTVLSRGAPARSGEGRTLGWAGINLDITDRKRLQRERDELLAEVEQQRHRAEELAGALEQEHMFLARIIENAPVAIGYIDEQEVFRLCNATAASYLGRTPEEVIGHPLEEVAPDEPELREVIRSVLRSGQPYPRPTLTVHRPGGEERHFLVAYRPDRADDGHVRGVFAMRQDITLLAETRRELEEERARLQRFAEELQRANREKDVFVGLISHEVRTPLTAIYGNAEVLQRRGGRMDEASKEQALADIVEEAQRLQRMVDNMLVFARAETAPRVAMEPLLVRPYIRRVVAEHQERFPQRPVRTDIQREHVVVSAEPTYLEQVLRNLVGNAEKYSPPEEPIELRAAAGDREFVITVLDRGPGIEPEEIEKVFEPFYRSGRTSEKAPGAGIGLTVCKLLVEAMRGRIWACQRDGGGSEFGFALPIYNEPAG